MIQEKTEMNTLPVKNQTPLMILFTANAISLVDNVLVRPMFLGLGIVFPITTLSMTLIPAMKEMNHRKEMTSEVVQ